VISYVRSDCATSTPPPPAPEIRLNNACAIRRVEAPIWGMPPATAIAFSVASAPVSGPFDRRASLRNRTRGLACRNGECYILSQMVQYDEARLDASFAALSDATRRGVLEQLGRADASITALAERFQMTLTGIKKHVGVLEQAGLVTTEKIGRVRTCKLGPHRLEEATAWIERHRQLWEARFDALETVLEELQRKEQINGRKKRK
jgi:DNA-binding transcriptional ArsR family regulator